MPIENHCGLNPGAVIFDVTGQGANVLDAKGFIGHMVSVTTSQPVSSMKAARDNSQTKGCGWAAIKPHVQKWVDFRPQAVAFRPLAYCLHFSPPVIPGILLQTVSMVTVAVLKSRNANSVFSIV